MILELPDRAAVPELVEPERHEVDGVPLYHLPMFGCSTIVTLAFGTGRIDEPATLSGITHLAEHLVMGGAGDAALDGNGRTEPMFVLFTYTGAPDDAAAFLRAIAASIASPHLDRVEAERSVLRTEAAGRGTPGIVGQLAYMRYGHSGLGRLGAPELAGGAIEADAVGDWVRTHLVRGNAAAWVAGVLPADLELALPPGTRPPREAADPIAGFEAPTLVRLPVPGVGASFVAPRTTELAIGFEIADRRLRRAMRFDRSLGYEVGGHYLPLDAVNAHVSAFAACEPPRVAEVEGLLLATLDELARRGPTEAELVAERRGWIRGATEPLGAPARLDRFVRNWLLGGQDESLAELAAQQTALTTESVRLAIAEAMDSMLLLVPADGFVPNRPLRPYPGSVPVAHDGPKFAAQRPRRRPWQSSPPAPALRINRDGVAISDPAGMQLGGVRWADCVLMVALGSRRVVYGRDGYELDIRADAWREGASAIRLLDAMAPPAVVVPIRGAAGHG